MPGELDGSSEHLAGFIVGALHDIDVVAAADIPRATSVAAEDINVNKAVGDYWCSWCSLPPEPSVAAVSVSDEAISFAAEGFAVRLIRLRPADQDRRIGLEVQARAHSLGGRFTTEMRVDDLLGFVTGLRDAHDAQGQDRIATLRSVAGDVIIEFRTHLGVAIGRYLFQSNRGNDNSATLSGSFRMDATILARLERDVRALVHDSWGEQPGR
jgi:hypothetical protein